MLATLLALALRLFPLSRPGYLSGDTQYDDGVYFGNALRLVHGVIAYRDFAMVHRGSLAVTLACAGYAIYPAALIASQTLLLEPWLNLFCLFGALLVFPPGRRAGSRRLAWGGACFGFAAAIKIWAFAPALLAGLTAGTERVRAYRFRLRAGPVDPRPVRPEAEAGRHHRLGRTGQLHRRRKLPAGRRRRGLSRRRPADRGRVDPLSSGRPAG